MRARLQVAAGGTVLLSTLLTAGCGLALGREEVQGPPLPPGADAVTIPEENVDTADVLVVVDDGSQIHAECAGREVVISADDAVVVLDGACGLVRTTGRGSTVDVGSADKIVLVGVDNTVSFAGGDPEVVNHGRNTTVAEGGSAEE
ncbi:DUF3060 domain-containing protein [Nocardiopsis sp. N85]|uniref:DUF3060 domain-containing protein n=1 Tax=Nocardiopsis sp. N85 TaxID=3029400 RepID=UPI00237F455A|nr:DUF3060 domain-containing protein [Nocardiopsis sp. N85]MDE3720344.1 DUF3060 domain-containing protein [Nocardiopsis sp. N85]